ncbi:MAG: hypothetical protein BJ554DRAFT_690, partial [Olpidium bornovanus]
RLSYGPKTQLDSKSINAATLYPLVPFHENLAFVFVPDVVFHFSRICILQPAYSHVINYPLRPGEDLPRPQTAATRTDTHGFHSDQTCWLSLTYRRWERGAVPGAGYTGRWPFRFPTSGSAQSALPSTSPK